MFELLHSPAGWKKPMLCQLENTIFLFLIPIPKKILKSWMLLALLVIISFLKNKAIMFSSQEIPKNVISGCTFLSKYSWAQTLYILMSFKKRFCWFDCFIGLITFLVDIKLICLIWKFNPWYFKSLCRPDTECEKPTQHLVSVSLSVFLTLVGSEFWVCLNFKC